MEEGRRPGTGTLGFQVIRRMPSGRSDEKTEWVGAERGEGKSHTREKGGGGRLGESRGTREKWRINFVLVSTPIKRMVWRPPFHLH